MEHVKQLFMTMGKHLETLARSSAIVAKPISIESRHVIPLCELSLIYGGGGGEGESTSEEKNTLVQRGTGGGAGGGAKVQPVAILVIDGNTVRLEKIGD